MYDQVVTVNRLKMEKELNKQSTYDKMSKELDLMKFTSPLQVQAAVHAYYKKNKQSMNLKTMAGYALTYCSINDLVSDELILAKMNEYFLG